LECVHWVRGPWGSEISAADVLKVYDPFYVRHGFNMAMSFKSAALLRGEVSLVLTFYVAVQEALALAGQPEIFLFFESDVVLRPDFLERLESVALFAFPYVRRRCAAFARASYQSPRRLSSARVSSI
jgi:hypothetical protein